MSNRSEILELLANGKISAAEAAELLNNQSAPATAVSEPDPTPSAKEMAATQAAAQKSAYTPEPRWLHVRVSNLETGKNKVTVNIPIKMVKFGLKVGGRFTPELAGLDWEELNSMMAEMDSGVLVEVQDEEGGEHVQIYVD